MGKIIDNAKNNLREVAEKAIELAVFPFKIPQALGSDSGGSLLSGAHPKLAIATFPFAVAASVVTSTIALGLFALAIPATAIDMIRDAKGMNDHKEEKKPEAVGPFESSYARLSGMTKSENPTRENSSITNQNNDLESVESYDSVEELESTTSSHIP